MLPEPYYQDESCTIYNCDCRDVLPHLPKVDLVFTSPPYNLGSSPWPHLGHWKPGDSPGGKSKWRNGSDGSGGVTYLSHGDSMPWAEYVEWQREFLRLCFDCLTDDGAIFYNHKPRVIGGRLWLPLELNPGLPLRQIVIWRRAGGMNFNPTAYVPTHEWIMIFAKDDFRLRDKGASGVGDCWYVPQEPDDCHPAPFPRALPFRAIETVMPHIVLDAHSGVGNTLLAAKSAGVPAIGIEIEEKYCAIAVDRLRQQTLFGPDPIPVNTPDGQMKLGARDVLAEEAFGEDILPEP
jgi:modification methylase